MELCILTNSKALISNNGNSFFFQILASKYPSKAFMVPSFRIFCLRWNFAVWQSRGCSFQMWQNIFQFSLNEAILDPNVFFSLTWNFISDKLKGADFKYDNNFSKHFPKFTQKGIFGTKFKSVFILVETLKFCKF